MDGRKAMATDGSRLGGTTVIVQYVDIYPSCYGDKFGGITPMSDTVGVGQGAHPAQRAGVRRPLVATVEDRKGTTWTVDGRSSRSRPDRCGSSW